jgi:hypothetical protein
MFPKNKKINKNNEKGILDKRRIFTIKKAG